MAMMETAGHAQSVDERSSFRFSATPASEQSALANSLSSAFPDVPQTDSFRPDVLVWKYFSTHPEWHTPRSYVLTARDHIVTHGGIWPIRLVSSSMEIHAAHLIDWAASANKPGTGVLLLRKLADQADPLLTIGGSSDTRAILPKLGYQVVGRLNLYARVVRPWALLRSTPHRDWKAPLRLARNAARSFSISRTVAEHWRAQQISQFDPSLEPILNSAPATHFASRRTIEGLNRFLRCPAAAFSGFLVFESECLCGYFMLSQVGGQTRIVDLHLSGEDPERWRQGFALASQTAAELPETCEIIVGVSSGRMRWVAEKNGFRLRMEDPLYFYDPRRRLGNHPVLEVSLLDSDACFTTDVRHPYLT